MEQSIKLSLWAAILLASICNISLASDYQKLIIGKWIQTEKTKSFDLSGDRFIKSPWFVSYEFTSEKKFGYHHEGRC